MAKAKKEVEVLADTETETLETKPEKKETKKETKKEKPVVYSLRKFYKFGLNK